MATGRPAQLHRGAIQDAGAADPHRPAVEPGAGAQAGAVQPVHVRVKQQAQYRFAGLQVTDRDAPAWHIGGVVGGAVDGVDQPEVARAAHRVLTAHFFAHHQIAGKGQSHLGADQTLNRQVSLRQHIMRPLGADLQLGRFLQGKFTALARQAGGKVQPGGQVSG